LGRLISYYRTGRQVSYGRSLCSLGLLTFILPLLGMASVCGMS